MSDVRFEQLDRTADSARFADLAAKGKVVELPQFSFNKKHVASQAQKNIDGLGDFGNYGVKLSIFKSNIRGAENDVNAAASDYRDAVSDVQDAQKQAMRMLHTLGPRIDRWFEASVSIVKLQKSLAAAHALDQKALQRFVQAAEGEQQLAAVNRSHRDTLRCFRCCRHAKGGDERYYLCRERAQASVCQCQAAGAMQVHSTCGLLFPPLIPFQAGRMGSLERPPHDCAGAA
jgi:hypothetical protein